jgi:hypothetical protein
MANYAGLTATTVLPEEGKQLSSITQIAIEAKQQRAAFYSTPLDDSSEVDQMLADAGVTLDQALMNTPWRKQKRCQVV